MSIQTGDLKHYISPTIFLNLLEFSHLNITMCQSTLQAATKCREPQKLADALRETVLAAERPWSHITLCLDPDETN